MGLHVVAVVVCGVTGTARGPVLPWGTRVVTRNAVATPIPGANGGSADTVGVTWV